MWACLTLCQAWVAAGKPPGRSLVGGFEPWSLVMDGILSNAGVGDLLGNSDSFRNTSVESGDEWRAFVPVWWSEHNGMKVTAKELAQLAEREELLVSLLEPANSDRGRGKRVGDSLKTIRDRCYGSFRVEFAGHNKSSTATYRLVRTDQPD